METSRSRMSGRRSRKRWSAVSPSGTQIVSMPVSAKISSTIFLMVGESSAHSRVGAMVSLLGAPGGNILTHPFDHVACARAGGEDPLYPGRQEARHVLLRHDAASEHDDVLSPSLPQERQHAGEEGVVSPGKDR